MSGRRGPNAGRPLGSRSPQTVTPAVIAKNKAINLLSKPGLRSDTDTDPQRRLDAFRLIGGLCLTTAQLATERVEAELKLLRDVRAMMDEGTITPRDAAGALRGLASLSEISVIMAQAHDRAGLPRRTVLDITMETAKPIMLLAPKELEAWTAREDEHALVAATGNGHANGHTEH